jgi:hypothetical protein
MQLQPLLCFFLLTSYLSSTLGRIRHAVAVDMGTNSNVGLFSTLNGYWCIAQRAHGDLDILLVWRRTAVTVVTDVFFAARITNSFISFYQSLIYMYTAYMRVMRINSTAVLKHDLLFAWLYLPYSTTVVLQMLKATILFTSLTAALKITFYSFYFINSYEH